MSCVLVQVRLVGEGTAAAMALDPPSLDLGHVKVSVCVAVTVSVSVSEKRSQSHWLVIISKMLPH